ncbi:hypothetical protein [Streptomyces sp. NPDC055749]
MRLLRQALTVTGIAGALFGAGLIAASTASAADHSADHFAAPRVSAADSAHGSEREPGSLFGVAKSIGSMIHTDKPSKHKGPSSSQNRGGAPASPASRGAATDSSAEDEKAGTVSPDQPSTKVHTSENSGSALPAVSTAEGREPAGPGAALGALGTAARDVTESTGRPVGAASAPVTEETGAEADATRSAAQTRAPVPGVLGGAGRSVGELTSPVPAPTGRVLAPVTQTLAPVTQTLAPVTAALAPVTEPVAHVGAPVTGALSPVTERVLRPVTEPLDPVLEPLIGGAGLGEVTAPIGISPSPAANTPIPPVHSSAVVPPAVSAPSPPRGADTADAITTPTQAAVAHGRHSQPTWQGNPTGSASGSAGDETGSAGWWTLPQDLPGGVNTPAGSAGSGGSSGSGTFAGPLLWTAEPRVHQGCGRSRPASTAWDVTASGLLYDARGPRIPG